MDWYPWYIRDFRDDTLHLSLAEEGAYRRLIDCYMVNRGPLMDDDAVLARLLGVGLDEWLAVAPKVRRFFRVKDGKLHQKRCEREIVAQNVRLEVYSQRGKKAAFARWSKTNDLDARRMLVHATLNNSTTTTSFSVESQRGLSEKKGVASQSLEDIIRAKGWVK